MNKKLSYIIFVLLLFLVKNVQGQECVIEYINHNYWLFPTTGGYDQIYISTNPYECIQTITCPSWVTYNWLDEYNLEIYCLPNSGGPRTGYLSANGQYFFYVSQEGTTTPLLPGTISGQTSVCYGTSPGNLQGSSPSGGNCNGNYSFQWQVSASPTSGFTNISGAISSSYSPPALIATTYYRRRVICSSEYQYSNILTITVSLQLSGGEIASDQLLMLGEIPASITSVSPGLGGYGINSYQWFTSIDNGNTWNIISYATDSAYDPQDGITSLTLYKRQFSNTCGSAFSNNVTITPMGTTYLDPDLNYIYSVEPKIEVQNYDTSLFFLPEDSLLQNITYVDGLGRTKQIINVFGGPALKDIVTPIVYDEFGREAVKYLPYSTSETNRGKYIDEAIYAQATYYSDVSRFPNEPAYAVTVFDRSPLNRVLKQGAPGTVWQPEQHPMRYNYGTNITSDIRFWCVNTDNSIGNPGSLEYYDPGTLSKTIIADENWTSGKLHTTEEFKDIKGNVVLKRSYVFIDTIVKPVETYYIYDDFNLLRYVLSPEAVENLDSVTILAPCSPLTKTLCYYYQYDSRKRMIIKQLPGAAQIYMVYDDRDRLVAVQDGKMRGDITNRMNAWIVTKYDKFNRPVLTGSYSISDSTTQKGMQGIVNTFYSDPANLFYTTRTNLWPNQGYDENSFPEDTTFIKYYTISYYDDYLFKGRKPFNTSEAISNYLDSNGNPIYQNNVRNLVTGGKILVLDGGDTYLTTTTYYDNKYRPIQMIRDLYTDTIGGNELTCNKYNFIGQVLQSKVNQIFNSFPTTINKYYSYDHMGRLLRTEQEIDGDIDGRVTPSEVSYDDLGQLKQKSLHVTTSGPLQSNEFKYNIRGWLTDINNPDNLEDDLFALRLYYNTTGVSPLTTQAQFNGNISGLIWKSGQETVDSLKRAYGFSYDELNRLLTSDYGDSVNFGYHSDHFNESVGSYDLNGNIVSLKRAGVDNGVYDSEYDDLSYTYIGNHLHKVVDGGDTTKGFIDLQNLVDDYSYDSVGNLTKDLNKGIATIKYNYLNLPSEVIKDANNRIVYTYDATGTKLKKRSIINGDPTDKYYAGAYEYSNVMVLDLIYTDEGVVNYDDGEFTYEYFLKDHLGNTRATFKPNGTTYTLLQTYDFYPFGMISIKTDRSSDNKYLYNGKELQDELGLDWYDYGARFYDPQLGRWNVVDPAAEKYQNLSPYNYVSNNPLIFIDPDGRSTSPVFDKEGSFLGTDDQGMSGNIIVADDPSKFKQNMKHEDAVKLGSTFSSARTDITEDAKVNIVSTILEGTELPDNSKINRSDFNLTLQNDPSGIGEYMDYNYRDNKHILNLDLPNGEWTVENIRITGGVHEIYGHGIKKWGDRFGGGGTHRKGYEAMMDSKYWNGSTDYIKKVTVGNYWDYYYNEVARKTGNNTIPERYREKFYKYYGK